MARQKSLAAEMEACQEAVSEALALIDGIRKAFESPWYEVLELRYIDGLEWDGVATSMGLSVSTCKRWHRAALDWIDFVGEARARSGMGAAQR
jgi:hypothetical protein